MTNLRLIRCCVAETESSLVTKAITQSSIQSLHLEKDFVFGSNVVPKEVNEIISLIKKSCLTQLCITNYDFNIGDTKAIVEAIRGNRAFRKVAFNCASIDDRIDTVCDLVENSTIVSIKLSRCYLRRVAIIRLCASIKKSSIVSLDLLLNGFDQYNHHRIILAICDLLENHGLQKLNLSYCGISSATIAAMLPSIRASTLIKFNIENFAGMDSNIVDEIEGILKVQKNILNRFKKMKSASNS